MNLAKPIIVGIGGFTSEVGKTTLLCQLLRAFPSWEAIKTTRGHYRSCGKDPHACCVSDLLDERAVIRSGRDLTYEANKDTGRYWDSGAANVHWVIATNDQVEEGIKEAIGRVRSSGVFVEGNSFSKFIKCDYFVMVAGRDGGPIKKSAREALAQSSALFIGDVGLFGNAKREDRIFANVEEMKPELPIYSASTLVELITAIRSLEKAAAA